MRIRAGADHDISESMLHFFDRFPSPFPTLRHLPPGSILQDLTAGLVLAAIALPGQLATARLAGLPPEIGLLAFAGGVIGYAIFGSNRFLSVGADTTTAPIFGGGLAAIAAGSSIPTGELAGLLALMVGVLLLAAGVIRAGWVADLLSIPVTAGFMAGISVHIAIYQLPVLLGISASGDTIFELLRAVWIGLPQTNPMVLLLGLSVFGASLALGKLAPKFRGALLAVIASAGAVAAFGLEARGVGVLGVVHAEIPLIGIPHAHDFLAVTRLAPLAFTVAMVCMMQTGAVVREFPSVAGKDDHVSPSFIGVGMGCIVAGLLGAFPVNASPPSTAMVAAAGAKSQAAGLFAVSVVILLVVFFGFLLAYVPQAALAGVLLTVAIRIVRLNEMRDILRRSPGEFALVAAAAMLVIALPIENGMLLAIVLSLLHSLFIVARPKTHELARAPGTTIWWPPEHGKPGEQVPGVLVFAPSASIQFTNARFVCRRLNEAAASRPDLHLVVIEASGVTDIDFTGAQVTIQTIQDLQADGIIVALARLSAERAQVQAVQTGLLAAVGADHIFQSVEDAVRALVTNPLLPLPEGSARPPR